MRRFPRLICATDRYHGDHYLNDRPGTLCFRSTFCQKYNPKVLNNDWYEFRMSQPLDYDYKKEGTGKGNFQRSSYRNFWFGDPKEPLPKSTAHAMMEESLDWWGKKKLVRLPYLSVDNFDKTVLAEKGLPEKLPSLKTTLHMTERRPVPESTTTADYKFPLHLRKPTEPVPSQIPDPPWMKYRLPHSQLTDLDSPKHNKVYSWQGECCEHSQCRYGSQEPSTDVTLYPEDQRFHRQ